MREYQSKLVVWVALMLPHTHTHVAWVDYWTERPLAGGRSMSSAAQLCIGTWRCDYGILKVICTSGPESAHAWQHVDFKAPLPRCDPTVRSHDAACGWQSAMGIVFAARWWRSASNAHWWAHCKTSATGNLKLCKIYFACILFIVLYDN